MSLLEANLAAISQTSFDGVITIDPAGTVRGWNHHAQHIFGWSEDEAIGRSIAGLILTSDRQSDFFKKISGLSAGKGSSPLIGATSAMPATRLELSCRSKSASCGLLQDPSFYTSVSFEA